MKKLITLLFVFTVLCANAQNGLLNGTGYAPNFSVTNLNGNSHELYNYLDSGYVTVLEFLSVTCSHCVMHAPGTENSYFTNGPSGNNSARFLGLEVNGSTDSAAVSNFANTHNVTFPIANDVSPYLINYEMYLMPGTGGRYAFEQQSVLVWQKSKRLNLSFGYKLIVGEYPFGGQAHLLPTLNIKFAW